MDSPSLTPGTSVYHSALLTYCTLTSVLRIKQIVDPYGSKEIVFEPEGKLVSTTLYVSEVTARHNDHDARAFEAGVLQTTLSIANTV